MGKNGFLTLFTSAVIGIGQLGLSGVASATETTVPVATNPAVTTQTTTISAEPAPADVSSTEAEASTLPTPATGQIAESNQAALAPKVKNAIAHGHGRQLLERTKNPDIVADLLRYGNVQTESSHSEASHMPKPALGHKAAKASAARRKVKAMAHSASCYGDPWGQDNWTEFGGTVAWIYVRENGWCGSGGWISWLGGPSFAHWSWGPFCIGNLGTNYSWDYWPSWVHMAIWGSLGTSYPWGCLTYNGGKEVIRIAWNGYWDKYNDYGF